MTLPARKQTEDREGRLRIEADLIIHNGNVFDSATGTFDKRDIAIGGGRILRIAPSLEAPPDATAINAEGKLVTPGLIDAHVHAFPYGHLIGLDVDPVSSRSGVTTFIDGGSTGSLNFLAFRKFVVEKVRSNLFALLNVSAIGQATDGIKGLEVSEFDDLRFLHLASAVEIVEGNRDVIVGIKVRMYHGLTSLVPISAARELADAVGLPLVVHLAPPPPSIRDIMPYLKAGDIITHIFHPGPGSLLDRTGRVRDEYKELRARGVLIDTGSARFHTYFPIVKAAFDQGFVPDIITTDLTANNVNNITIDLPTNISKLMAFGMELGEALQKVTSAPARLLPPGFGFGTIAEGMAADLAIFSVEEGRFAYDDYYGNTITAEKRLVHEETIRAGEVLTPEAQPETTMQWGFVKK